ncbi:MAG: c-type cytochrome [Bacteriovoracaceae bacterium]|nr:c-type cytochrome [Bacteriovoracaceae bacterium]
MNLSPLDKKEKDLLLDHEYDGIQELDHPLPSWWIATFVLTVLFSIPYFIYYVGGFGPSLLETHEKEMASIQEIRESYKKKSETFDVVQYEKFKPSAKVAGAVIFEENCLPCHKADGTGDIGPNLTDAYWIHGSGTPADLYKTVYHGVEALGMPVWSETLSPEDIYRVVAYVHEFIKDKNLPGKEPQGNKVE